MKYAQKHLNSHLQISRAALCAMIGMILLGCATTQTTYKPVASSNSGKLRLEGIAQFLHTSAGSQDAQFVLNFAELYGTRIEVLGPAGTPLLFATVNPNSFDVYSAIDRILVRDTPANVIHKSDKNMLAITSLMLSAIASYGSNFAPASLFEKPTETRYGHLWNNPEIAGQVEVKWIVGEKLAKLEAQKKQGNDETAEDEERPVFEPDTRPGLSQIILDTGTTYVFATRMEDQSYAIHFGNGYEVMRLKVTHSQDNFSLQGLQWKLLVPPGSSIMDFAGFMDKIKGN